MGYAKKCWVLLITRDMRVHVPPELYLNLDQAEDEARRWLSVLFGWRPTSKRVSTAGAVPVGRRFALHMIDFEMHESWHAGSLWIGAEWNDRSFPRMQTELLPTGVQGAHSWAASRLSRRLGVPMKTSPWECRGQYEFKGKVHHVSASRIKYLCGPWSGAD